MANATVVGFIYPSTIDKREQEHEKLIEEAARAKRRHMFGKMREEKRSQAKVEAVKVMRGKFNRIKGL